MNCLRTESFREYNRAPRTALLCVLLLTVVALSGCKSPTESKNPPPVPTISEGTFNAQNDLLRVRFDAFMTESTTLGEDSARKLLLTRFQADTLVDTAQLLSDSISIDMRFRSGMRCVVIAYNPALLPDSAWAPPRGRSGAPFDYLDSIGANPRALIIDPYHWVTPDYEYLRLRTALAMAGYSIDEQINTAFGVGNVDLGDYQNWSNYGIVIVRTHGGRLGISSGVPVDWEGFNQETRYSRIGYCPDGDRPVYFYEPSYFAERVAAMPGTLVMIASCYSGSSTWAQAFTSRQAGAYVGFPELIAFDAEFRAFRMLMDLLRQDNTLGEAAQQTTPRVYAGPEDRLNQRLGRPTFQSSGTWWTSSGGSGGGTVSLASNDGAVTTTPCGGVIQTGQYTVTIGGWVWTGTARFASCQGTCVGEYSVIVQGHTYTGTWSGTWTGTVNYATNGVEGTWTTTDDTGDHYSGGWSCTITSIS